MVVGSEVVVGSGFDAEADEAPGVEASGCRRRSSSFLLQAQCMRFRLRNAAIAIAPLVHGLCL